MIISIVGHLVVVSAIVATAAALGHNWGRAGAGRSRSEAFQNGYQVGLKNGHRQGVLFCRHVLAKPSLVPDDPESPDA